MAALVPALAGVFLSATALIAGGLLVLPILRSTFAARRAPSGEGGKSSRAYGKPSRLSTKEDGMLPAAYAGGDDGEYDEGDEEGGPYVGGEEEELDEQEEAPQELAEDDGWVENKLGSLEAVAAGEAEEEEDAPVPQPRPLGASAPPPTDAFEDDEQPRVSVARTTRPDFDDVLFKYKDLDL